MKRSRAERRKAAKSQHRERKKRRKLSQNDSIVPQVKAPSAPADEPKTRATSKAKPGKKRSKARRRSRGVSNTKETEEMKASLKLEFAENKGNLSDWLNSKHPYYREAFCENWQLLQKSVKLRYIKFDRERINGARLEIEKIKYPFESNADDHCETSPTAYKDIVPMLKSIAKLAGRTPETLRIYDPYYCSGAVVRNLADLGFSSVYNKCEDFYKVVKKKKVPVFDVLVTNPPYSETHVKRLLRFCAKQSVPCLLLMPNHIQDKPFFSAPEFTLLKPVKRYVYWTPKGLRGKDKQQNHASALGYRTSPFPTMWYCDLKFKPINLRELYAGSKALQVQASST